MSKRLGSNGDADEIQKHPFFEGVNWDALYNREIQAEYVPDLKMIEEEQKNNMQ